MDRTSILGDTIDYMKELLERINKLQEGKIEEGTNHFSLMGISKELNPSEVLVRNSPKVKFIYHFAHYDLKSKIPFDFGLIDHVCSLMWRGETWIPG